LPKYGIGKEKMSKSIGQLEYSKKHVENALTNARQADYWFDRGNEVLGFQAIKSMQANLANALDRLERLAS
jgi:hypothetical protein